MTLAVPLDFCRQGCSHTKTGERPCQSAASEESEGEWIYWGEQERFFHDFPLLFICNHFSEFHCGAVPFQGPSLCFSCLSVSTGACDKPWCFLFISQVRRERVPGGGHSQEEGRALLSTAFFPRDTEGPTHFRRICMWPLGQSHNHRVQRTRPRGTAEISRD